MANNNNFQRYKDHLETSLNHLDFSFSQRKPSPAAELSFVMTSGEKRALGMWVSTILELHSEEFLHALKHCRRLSIPALNQYMLLHYGHLKLMIRYFIIAALIDYQYECECESPSNQQNKQETPSDCVLLNIVIEELTQRFFRESQWLHKISHLPVYFLFAIFDPFMKGYISVRDIRHLAGEVLEGRQQRRQHPKAGLKDKKVKKMERLLHKKMANNIECKDPRIYQENFEEVVSRANLIIFEDVFSSQSSAAGIGGSSRYHFIEQVIKVHQRRTSEIELNKSAKDLAESRREREELELMREDYSIKQKSEIMSRKEYQSQFYPQTLRKEWNSTGLEEVFVSTAPPSTKLPRTPSPLRHPLTDTTANLHPSWSYSDQVALFNSSSATKPGSSSLHQQALHLQTAKSKLSTRALVLQQLQVIKLQKRKAHLHYLQYF